MIINLLPPQEKNELLEEQRYKLLLISGVSIIFFLIVLSLLLFSIKIVISGKAQGQELIIPQELQDSEKEILAINEKIQKVASFYENQRDFPGFLGKIYQIIPSGAYLNSLSLNFSEKEESFSVYLQGFSPTRENLLQLKNNLESEPGFKNINFPLSNLLKPDNIDFNINFQAKP